MLGVHSISACTCAGAIMTAACGHANECFHSFAAYARRVAEISATLYNTHGLTCRVHNVLVTSDEKDPAWWDESRRSGAPGGPCAGATEELYGKLYALSSIGGAEVWAWDL